MAYYRVEPFGDDWKQAAMIGSICSTAATNSKYERTIPARDLIPQFGDREDVQMTPEESERQMIAMASSFAAGGG